MWKFLFESRLIFNLCRFSCQFSLLVGVTFLFSIVVYLPELGCGTAKTAIFNHKAVKHLTEGKRYLLCSAFKYISKTCKHLIFCVCSIPTLDWVANLFFFGVVPVFGYSLGVLKGDIPTYPSSVDMYQNDLDLVKTS